MCPKDTHTVSMAMDKQYTTLVHQAMSGPHVWRGCDDILTLTI